MRLGPSSWLATPLFFGACQATTHSGHSQPAEHTGGRAQRHADRPSAPVDVRSATVAAPASPEPKAALPQAPGTAPTRCGGSEVPWVWPAVIVGRRDYKGGPKTVTVDTVLPWAIEVGQAVSVVVVSSNLPAQDLVVTEVRAQPAVDEYPASWVVGVDAGSSVFASLEPQAWGDTWSDTAILVCPAGPVSLVAPADVDNDLPARTGTSLATLWAAVDTTGDGRPDTEIFRFWCDTPDVSTSRPQPGASYLSCQSIYRRAGRKRWKLVHDSRDD